MVIKPKPDIQALGLKHLRRIKRNLPTPSLYEEIINNREGQIAHLGPVVVRTGHDAEVDLADRFIVKDPESETAIFWSEEKNELSENQFNSLFNRLVSYLHNKDVYVQDCYYGSVDEYRIPIRVVTENAWLSLFARNMFYQVSELSELEKFEPEFTIVHIPGFHAIPETDGTNSASFVIISLARKMALIGGTTYAGQLKQTVFTIASYLLPDSVFCMRCSANVGESGDVAIFLGREETGKTTLAVDSKRRLLGDHAHGWCNEGIFNLEWGGYAKVFAVDKSKQPYIYECTRKFGTVLENVSIDMETRRLKLSDGLLTENTRAAYPITHIPGAIRGGIHKHPKNLFLLTCDAFGVIPPIARLTPEQAVYAFLSAYTSKFKKTEGGEVEPEVMFNVCFGDSALAFPAFIYGQKLMEKIKANNVKCWLMNTGWSGEPYTRGERIPIEVSRKLVHAAVSGAFDEVSYETDPIFQYEIPESCPAAPELNDILNPRKIAEDEGEYELRANRLVAEFVKDFEQFGDHVPDDMREMLSQIISVDDKFDIEESGFSL